MDSSAIYRDSRNRFVALIEELPSSDLSLPVPTCPGWRVRDITAHLAGSAIDVVAGSMEGAPGDQWTAAHVDARRDRGMEEILLEWEGVAPKLEGMLGSIPSHVGRLLIVDMATHEQDVRGAVGRPGGRDSQGYALMFDVFLNALRRRITEAELPALLIQMGEDEHIVGREEPAATVRGPAFEILRGISGRRSWRQIEGWDWDGNYTPFQSLVPHFKPPTVDIME